jgi:hypothetical protein
MDDGWKKLRGAFGRNVSNVNRGAFGSPETPSEAPLPEYFQDQADTSANNALLKMLAAAGMGGLAYAAPPAAPWLAGGAGLSLLGASSDLGEMGDNLEGANMWRSTGLPQRPRR